MSSNLNPWDVRSDDDENDNNNDENHSNNDIINDDNVNDEDIDEFELEERLKRDEEDNEKRLLIARVKKRLDDILSVDPFIRNKRSILLKAFVVWNKVHPLNQKCNELAHQLQERISVVESLRDSYLRDVVAVKYYLNKIHEYKQVQDQQQVKTDGLPDMYDLHAIPSTSLRHLIDKAKQGSEMTSDSLQEALIMSGLITPGSGKEIQVWDKSKMFKKQMKINHGQSYKLPQTGGGTINVSAPGKHKVFVKYCNSCIGVMSFVHEWNQSIEEGLKRNVESLSYEANMQKLKVAMMNLNKIIEDQETELIDMKKKYFTLQKSGKWMEDWKNSLEIKESGVEFMKEELSKWKNCAGMADAERETRVNETVYRFNEKIAKLQYQLIESNREIDRQVSINDKQRQSQVEVIKKLSTTEAIIKERDQDLKFTKSTLEDKVNEIKKLNMKVISLQRDEANAIKKQNETQAAFDDFKIENEIKNDDLRSQVMQLEVSVFTKDETIEKLNDLVRELKNDIKSKAKTIQNYVDRDRMMEDDRIARELAIAEAIARKPKHSLKVIALFIMCGKRMTKAITAVRERNDFSLMGALGRRDQLSREHIKHTHLKKLISEAEEEIKNLNVALKVECQTTKNLTDQNAKHTMKIEKLEKSIDKYIIMVKEHEKNYKELNEQYNKKEEQFLDSQREVKNLKAFISKFSIITQMQRNLATKVIHGVNQTRNILSIVEIADKKTEDTSTDGSKTVGNSTKVVSASFINTNNKSAEEILVPPSPASLRLHKFKDFCHEFFRLVKKEGTSERRSTLIPFKLEIYCPPVPDNPRKVFLNKLTLVSNYKADLDFIEGLTSKLTNEADSLSKIVTTLKDKNQNLTFVISEKEKREKENQEKLDKTKKKLRSASKMMSLHGLSVEKKKSEKKENSILKKISQKNARQTEHEKLLSTSAAGAKEAKRASKLEKRERKMRKSLLENSQAALPSQIVVSKNELSGDILPSQIIANKELSSISEESSFGNEQNEAAIVLQRKIRKSISIRRSISDSADIQSADIPIKAFADEVSVDTSIQINNTDEEHNAAIVLQQRMRQSLSRKKSLSSPNETMSKDARMSSEVASIKFNIVGTKEEHAAASVLQRRLSINKTITQPVEGIISKPSDFLSNNNAQSPKNNIVATLKSLDPNAQNLDEEQRGQANLLKFMFGGKVTTPVYESSSDSDSDSDFDSDDDISDEGLAEKQAWDSMLEKMKRAEEECERLGIELASTTESESRLHQEVDQLKQSIHELEEKRKELQMKNKEHEEYLSRLLKDYQSSMNENANLRESVEDSYRSHIAEVGKIESDRIRKSIKEEEDRRAMLRNRGTYISCSVCAIRAIVIDKDGHRKKDPESNNRDSYDPHSSCFEDNLDTIEKGDKVIIAYPKDINEHSIDRYLLDNSITRGYSLKETDSKYDNNVMLTTLSSASNQYERQRPYSANYSLSRKVKSITDDDDNNNNVNSIIQRSNSANTNIIKEDNNDNKMKSSLKYNDKRSKNDNDDMPNTKFRSIKQFPTRGYNGGPVRSQVTNASAFLQNEMLLKLEEKLTQKQLQSYHPPAFNDNI